MAGICPATTSPGLGINRGAAWASEPVKALLRPVRVWHKQVASMGLRR